MSAGTRAARPVAALACAVIAWAGWAAPLPELRGDGWKSWRVPAVPDAPGWCCYRWRDGDATPARCSLDSNDGYGGQAGSAPVSHMRVYARIGDGRWRAVRAYAENCPVEARGGIEDLGDVDPASSVAALAGFLTPRGHLTGHAFAAIAVHDGAAALAALVDAAGSDRALETRKSAVFWLGQTRSHDGATDLTRLMFGDANARLREHAAFSVSQSAIPDRAALLTRLARRDESPQVRGQAWFWLAQTGASESEAAIGGALVSETSRHVREQAIFALSQLPEPRGARALIDLARSEALAQGDRRRAVFWLAQSEDDAARAYLETLLEP